MITQLPHDSRMIVVKSHTQISDNQFLVQGECSQSLVDILGENGEIESEFGLEIMAQALGYISSISAEDLGNTSKGGYVALVRDYIIGVDRFHQGDKLAIDVLLNHIDEGTIVGECSLIVNGGNSPIQSASITIQRFA